MVRRTRCSEEKHWVRIKPHRSLGEADFILNTKNKPAINRRASKRLLFGRWFSPAEKSGFKQHGRRHSQLSISMYPKGGEGKSGRR
ncbi:hypothetical protein M0657_005006 [Pyricularia oryzae]|nr:hypothetical protein M9X92_006885 [Pyricularia oryzae]KAI7923690.1 hypothetical protein M0657_005006 [Pyricularia oryzae]